MVFLIPFIPLAIPHLVTLFTTSSTVGMVASKIITSSLSSHKKRVVQSARKIALLKQARDLKIGKIAFKSFKNLAKIFIAPFFVFFQLTHRFTKLFIYPSLYEEF